MSPSIPYSTDFSTSMLFPCGVYHPKDRKVVFRGQNYNGLFQWYLGDDSVTELQSVTDFNRYSAHCGVSSKFETMVMYGGIYSESSNSLIPQFQLISKQDCFIFRIQCLCLQERQNSYNIFNKICNVWLWSHASS